MATETLEDNKSDQQPPLSEENKAAENEEAKSAKDKGIAGKEKISEDEKAREEANEDTETDEKSEQEEDEEVEATETAKAKGRHKESAKDDRSESSHNKVGNDPVTPGADRPTRVRKTVERYSEPSPTKSAKSSSSKTLPIEKGRGTQLKDIPNVAFKLSKRKPDENLQVLHSMLFGKKAKAHSLKRNIGQFSGYVWVENEEKQRAKVKEKLDKCVKEKLVDFCDVLNIPINKASIKKEELSAKLLEFLESPHATTDALLSEKKQKGQKQKRKAMPSKSFGDLCHSSMEAATKKKTQTSHVGKKQKRSSGVEDEDVQVEPADPKHDSQEDDVAEPNEDHEESKSEEKEDEKPKADKVVSKKKAMEGSKNDGTTPVKKASGSKAVKRAEKTPKSSTLIKNATDHDTYVSKSKQSVSDKQKTTMEKRESKVKATSTKADKSLARASAKDQGKGKSRKKTKVEPSTSEMHAVVVDILKEVDFNTATLSDILRQLGTHFGLDLMHKKAEVKDIITDVINNMSDEEEEGEEDEDVRNSDDADKEDDSDG